MKITDKIIYGLLFFIAFFYLFFPTNNSSLDAFNYAASVKYGIDLFEPHHLLYNGFLFIIYRVLGVFINDIDILSLSKIVNSLFAIVNLVILFRILEKLKIDKKEIVTSIIIVAFSYSSLRYGTENETYIIPITFSLLGSYYFLCFLNSKKHIFILLSGLFASLTCLFHQIHIFWWFGLLIGLVLYEKKFITVFLYGLPALTIPIAYSLVLYYYNHQEISINNLWQFVLHDYHSGSAKSELGLMNLVFVVISGVRTFFEVHPKILILMKYNRFFIVPFIALLAFMYKILKSIITKKLFSKRKNSIPVFAKTHLLILILHLSFSFFAVGNVEFLVMMPFLFFFSIFYIFKLHFKVLTWTAVTLFIWNFSFGLYANNKFNYYNDYDLISFMLEHPEDTFIVKDQTVLSQYYYQTGYTKNNTIYASNIKDLDKVLSKLNKPYFYTDIINKPEILNRAKILENTTLNFSEFKKEKVKDYVGLYGTSTIYKIYYDN